MPAVPELSATRADTGPVHWAALREAGMTAGLWFLYALYRVGGRRVYRWVLWPVALYFALSRPVARRASVDYLQRVGVLAADVGWLRRLVHVTRHLAHFADVLLDKALVWAGAIDLADAQLNVDPQFEADVRSGRGGVLVVAHLGNLEALRALGKRLPQLKLNILVHTRHAQRFNRVLERLNPESAAQLLQVTEIDASIAIELAQRVAGGEYVVIAADRVPVANGRNEGRSQAVPFLGSPAPLPIGPWVLAAALGCPVYWLACIKHGERYTLDCERLFERIVLPRAQRPAALAHVMTRYAQRLEQACRSAPYAWFNFYPFWAAGPTLRAA